MDPNGWYQTRPSQPNESVYGHRAGSVQNGSQERAILPEQSARPQSRAEKFEDEKRRIMASCFKKVDEKGNLLESYITHIRVVEDAMSPSAPPSKESPPEHRKPRVVILAVKNTGRVFMYKARENENGMFQIGKDWDLDQMRLIESFTYAMVSTVDEQQRAKRAGTTGFIITMAKSYYWQANTAKEKEFFLASLVKIYKKYTQGRIPELRGFSKAELDKMLGGAGQQPPVSTAPLQTATQQDLSRNNERQAGVTPDNASADSRSGRPPVKDFDLLPPTSATSYERSTSSQHQPSPSNDRQIDPSSRPYGPSREVSDDQMHPYRFQPPPPNALKPQLSHSHFVRERSESPAASSTTLQTLGASSRTIGRPPPTHSDEIMSKLPPDPQSYFNGAPLAPSTTARWKSNGIPMQSTNGFSETPPVPPQIPSLPQDITTSRDITATRPSRSPEPLPQRKRPPLNESELTPPLARRSLESPISKDDAMSNALPPDDERSRRGAIAKLRPQIPPTPLTPSEGGTGLDSGPGTGQSSEGSVTDLKTSALGSDQSLPIIGESTEDTEVEHYKPGLGPMVKLKPVNDAVSKFRKAATAASAFKPRAGSAAHRLLQSQPKPSDEPDGVKGVVPAPLQRGMSGDSVQQTPGSDVSALSSPFPSTPGEVEKKELPVPAVKVSFTDEPSEKVAGDDGNILRPPSQGSEGDADKSPPVVPPRAPRARRRRSANYTKGLIALEIDPSTFGHRGLEFESILVEIGWDDDNERVRKVESLEADLKREIIKSESGPWLNSLDGKDDRISAVENMLDKTIAECEQLDGLLTLYGVELSTLNEDVAYIEAQSQGLQVQTANQKQLHAELQNLVKTLTINTRHMDPLRQSSLGDNDGLSAIESCLLSLYKALGSPDSTSANHVKDDISNMRALQEKKNLYMQEATAFLGRLRNYMDPTFGAAAMQTKDALARTKANPLKLDIGAHDTGRRGLWKYSPIMLFAREIDMTTWNGILKIYQGRIKPVYQDEFRDNISAWRSKARKVTEEQLEILFTYQEKEQDGLTSTSGIRKVAVKRSHTIARSFRPPSREINASNHTNLDGQYSPHEVFAGALDMTTPIVCTEQNFIIDFFHATSLANMDFNDAVMAARPAERIGTNLFEKKALEPDRTMARQVSELAEEIFSFWANDMQTLSEWVTSSHPLQGLGMLCVIEAKISELEDCNQDFVMRTLHKLRESVFSRFTRCIDEQVRAIEETKVKTKKRKGVMRFVRIFPMFSAAIEDIVLPFDGPEKQQIRSVVDDAYEQLNKAMWDSLKVIAKESPAAMAQSHVHAYSGLADPEDKEALNHHILLLENLYHCYVELDERGDAVLASWRARAQRDMEEHQGLYLGAIIRRPLGKLLDFIQSTEALMSSPPGSGNPTKIPITSPSHSRSVFKKLLASNDSKELRKGIETMMGRINKHFRDADDAAISQKLIDIVFKDCARRYEKMYDRLRRIAREVYEDSVEVDFRREDIAQQFLRR